MCGRSPLYVGLLPVGVAFAYARASVERARSPTPVSRPASCRASIVVARVVGGVPPRDARRARRRAHAGLPPQRARRPLRSAAVNPVDDVIPRSEMGGAQRAAPPPPPGPDSCGVRPRAPRRGPGPLARSLDELDVPYPIGPSFRSVSGIARFAGPAAARADPPPLRRADARRRGARPRPRRRSAREPHAERGRGRPRRVAVPRPDAQARAPRDRAVAGHERAARGARRPRPGRSASCRTGVFLEDPKVGRAKLRASLSGPRGRVLAP